jgi:hypothetical protein
MLWGHRDVKKTSQYFIDVPSCKIKVSFVAYKKLKLHRLILIVIKKMQFFFMLFIRCPFTKLCQHDFFHFYF